MKYEEMENALAKNQDVESIKEDIKDIMERLKNFDAETLKELYNDSEFMSKISDFKEKFYSHNSCSIMKTICSVCMGKGSIENALKFTILGALLGKILRI